MKNSKICTKCKGAKVVKITKDESRTNLIDISAFKIACPTKYICCECGFFEEYIDNAKDRLAIYEKFKNNK